MSITVAEAIVKCLEIEGIEYAFGVIGSHYLALFDALINSKIKFISVKHESSAGFMALNYAKISQKPALLLGTAGPGAMNLLNGIAELSKSKIPAFIISPVANRKLFGKNCIQEDTGWSTSYSIIDVVKPICRKSIMAILPETIPFLIRDLFRFAFSDIYGPVHMAIPTDLFKEEIPFDPIPISSYRVCTDERIEDSKIQTLSLLIGKSKSPLLFIGERVIYPDCSEEINKLVNTFKIPFITSHTSKGIISEQSSLFAGVLDIFGHKSAEKIIKNSDLVISIGSDFSEQVTIKYDPEIIKDCIHVCIDSNNFEIGKNYKVDIGVVGSIKSNLQRLIHYLNKINYSNSINEDSFHKEIIMINSHEIQDQNNTQTPLKPQAFFSELSKYIPKNSLVFTDVGSSGFWTIRNFLVRDFSYFSSPSGFSMGQGVAGCIGGKVASPDKTTFCICGDGAFLMHGMEISTAIQFNLGIIWIILKDSKYNIVDWGQKLFFNNRLECFVDISLPDFNKFADAFSLKYFEISNLIDISNYLPVAVQHTLDSVSSLVVVNYDVDEFLPIKPNAVKTFEDFTNPNRLQSSKYLMKAFSKVIREKI